MRSFFNLDGPVFVFLSKVADLVIVNLLFILCCIPIFTIGASATALSYVTHKMKDGDEGYITKSFFKSFRQNFRQATVIWLIMLAFLVLLILDFLILRATTATSPLLYVVKFAVFLGAFLWTIMFLYVFPVLSRFENTIKGTVRNGIMMAFANAPKMLLTIVIIVGAVLLTLYNTTTFVYGILVWIMAGFAVLSYINSSMQNKLFHKFMPEEQEEEMTAGSFSWEQEEKEAEGTEEAEKQEKTEERAYPEALSAPAEQSEDPGHQA